MKLLAKNRRANFDYAIGDKLVAGLALTGSEVKSIKAGHASLKGAFITIRDDEAWLNNAHVTPYQAGGQRTLPDPVRTRKLLLHRKQLDELIKLAREGTRAVPLALLLSGPYVKLELGLGRGKKSYDKRETIKRRESDREARRAVKNA